MKVVRGRMRKREFRSEGETLANARMGSDVAAASALEKFTLSTGGPASHGANFLPANGPRQAARAKRGTRGTRRSRVGIMKNDTRDPSDCQGTENGGRMSLFHLN